MDLGLNMKNRSKVDNYSNVVQSTEFAQVRRTVTQAVNDYGMISSGERIMIAVSGGKDSSLLAIVLSEMKRIAPFDFDIVPVILDQHQPGFVVEAYADWMQKDLGLELQMISEDTYSIVKEKTKAGKSFCGLCSRLRRGILYNYAYEHNYTRIALGHHADDLNETLLMNLFFSGMTASMPPYLRSDDQRNTVIRPLCYVQEKQIQKITDQLAIPIIPCRLCGTQDGMQRARVKGLINDLEQDIPNVRASMLAAIQNVRVSQLADRKLSAFGQLVFEAPNNDSTPDHMAN